MPIIVPSDRHAEPPQVQDPHCTIVRDDGEPCGRDVPNGSPISACGHHLIAAHQYCEAALKADLRWVSITEPIPHRTAILDPVVYYAKVGYYIKIGTTGNLALRMAELGVDAVLAVEWGSYALEKTRHIQFRESKAIGVPGREFFYPTHDLRDHMLKVRAEWRDGADGYSQAKVDAKVAAICSAPNG